MKDEEKHVNKCLAHIARTAMRHQDGSSARAAGPRGGPCATGRKPGGMNPAATNPAVGTPPLQFIACQVIASFIIQNS